MCGERESGLETTEGRGPGAEPSVELPLGRGGVVWAECGLEVGPWKGTGGAWPLADALRHLGLGPRVRCGRLSCGVWGVR